MDPEADEPEEALYEKHPKFGRPEDVRPDLAALSFGVLLRDVDQLHDPGERTNDQAAPEADLCPEQEEVASDEPGKKFDREYEEIEDPRPKVSGR